MDEQRKLEAKLALAAKRKFPGLTPEKVHDIINKVKKDNNGTLAGLTIAAFMGLVKKKIHEQNRIDIEKWKEEKRDASVTCPICFSMFSDQSSRNRHMQAKHGKARVVMDKTGFDKKCTNCKKCFKYDFSLAYHIERFHSKVGSSVADQTDEDSSLFECKKCGKLFRHQPSLKRHMKTHDETETEEFKCEKCDATFSRKDNLIKHEKRVHNLGKLNVDLIRKDAIKEFLCKMCGRNFGSDRIKFEAHLMLRVCQQPNQQTNMEVDDYLRFPCGQCDKTYAEKDSLDRHVRWKHSGPIEPFKCSECDATFKLKSSLKRHIKTEHVGSKLVI